MKQSKRQPRMNHLVCMTNAEGDLSACVSIVKDRRCQKEKVVIKPVEHNLWTCFVHPDYKKEDLQRALLKGVFIPVIVKKQKLVAAQLGKDEDGNVVISDTQDLSQGDPAPSHKEVTGEKRPRAILTFDGANETIECIMHSSMAEKCQQLNIALFKWAAACSLVQQPNDVSICHKILHKLFKSYAYSQKGPMPINMTQTIKHMKDRCANALFHLQASLTPCIAENLRLRRWRHLPCSFPTSPPF